ncbi:SCO2322 family protein [Kitasatospora sp. NPDC094015]|uniref:SCO2322 family protein n=1 Tax=Kitasatospora sp. NPDC094015 TaxID=3155205 RepID=UPI00332E2F8D
MTPAPHGRAPHRALPALVLALLLTALAGATAAPAEAAGYRYWSFWKWSGDAWTYQQQGPVGYLPPDGAVDGWRFADSPDGGREAARPGAPGDFAAICADTPAAAGRKRVGVVLDFGTATDAPPGTLAAGENPPAPRTACASVPTGASSAEVVAAAAPPLRYDSAGLLCAIAGYPRAGCGEPVVGGATASHDSGPSVGLIAGAAAVLLLGTGAVWQARRRRHH